MPRKNREQRSGQERRGAEEQVDPRVDSPSEITREGGSGTRGEGGYSMLGGGEYPEEGSTDDAPPQGDWQRHSSGGRRQHVRRRPDESLAQEIREVLTNDPELDATEIEVQVEGGAVTLSGTVDSSDAKLLAEELTESFPGVREVHNRLVIER